MLELRSVSCYCASPSSSMPTSHVIIPQLPTHTAIEWRNQTSNCRATHKEWCSDCSCERKDRHFKVSLPDTGFGNRLSKLLSAAGVAWALGRPVLTFWPTPGNTGYKKHMGRRFYGELAELRTLMHLPRGVQWIEDWPKEMRRSGSGAALNLVPLHDADQIPTGLVLRGQLDFGWGHPTAVWVYWQYWWRRHMWPKPCVDRSSFIASMRDVFAQVRPLVDLNNPLPRSYLVLHWRHGDRGSLERSDPAAYNLTWRCVSDIARHTTLPWLVVAEDPHDVPFVEAIMRQNGARIWPPRPASPGSNSSGSTTLRPVVRDFFAIAGSAGLLFSGNAFGQWIDSSFSSMAALVGELPMLFPRSTSSGGNIATMQALGNQSGDALHSYFFADQIHRFLVEIQLARLRPFGNASLAGRHARRAEPMHDVRDVCSTPAPESTSIP